MKKPISLYLMETKGERTRRKILEATLHCITHIGIERTSQAEIAKKAKVSRGLVAHYFPVKSEMFHSVIEFVKEDAYAYFQANHTEIADPRARALDRLVMNALFFATHPDHYKCIVLLYYVATIDRKYRAANSELVQAAVDGIAEPLAEVTDRTRANAIAETLHNELIASIQKFYMINHDESREAFVERLRKHFKSRIDAV